MNVEDLEASTHHHNSAIWQTAAMTEKQDCILAIKTAKIVNDGQHVAGCILTIHPAKDFSSTIALNAIEWVVQPGSQAMASSYLEIHGQLQSAIMQWFKPSLHLRQLPCKCGHARIGYLGSVADAMAFPDLQKRLDVLLQVTVHVVVIEDTGSAAVGELVGMSLAQVVPGKWPVIQGGACSTGPTPVSPCQCTRCEQMQMRK